jgi:NAD(P)-dependent dehydrogenase (short-subunit alcohol dehydrogenase family)
MKAFSLETKCLLITGASSGLGRQVAITASQAGATLIITGRNSERLLETFNLLNGTGHISIPADLTKDEDINELVSQLPGVHGVFFSVGISTILPVSFISREKLSHDMSVNFMAPVLLTTALLRAKKLVNKDCSLLYMSTISTVYPFVGGGMYISARAAIEGYARVLALELAPKGIRVNCLRSGFVKTPMLDQTAKMSQEVVGKIEKQQPLGIGEPEDVANTAIFYFADASRWVSGTNLILGGG